MHRSNLDHRDGGGTRRFDGREAICSRHAAAGDPTGPTDNQLAVASDLGGSEHEFDLKQTTQGNMYRSSNVVAKMMRQIQTSSV